MLKYIWKNKIVLILIILALWLVPNVIGLSEQSQTESIVTAIGIDKQEDEYEVSLQYIIPSTSGSAEGLKITSQKGKTIGTAIEKIKLQLGKLSGFAHCRFLAFNDNACEENFTQLLDFLIRRKTNTSNIILVNTPDSAKDLLSMSNKLDSDLYSFLNNNGFSNELGDFHDLKTIGDYYSSYFSPVKCIFINSVNMKAANSSSQENSEGGSSSTDNTSGGSGSGGESSNSGSSGGGDSSSSSNSSQGQKEFENKGELVIIKNEKKLLTLSQEESDNLSWFNPKIKRDQFSVENYSEGNLQNSNILFNVINKTYKATPYFLDGKPCLKIDLKLYVRTGEVATDNLQQKDYEVLQRKFSDKLIMAMKDKIISSMKKAEENFKTNNYDVINCYNTFYKKNSRQFKDYINKLENKEDFIKNVTFEYNIEFIQGS